MEKVIYKGGEYEVVREVNGQKVSARNKNLIVAVKECRDKAAKMQNEVEQQKIEKKNEKSF